MTTVTGMLVAAIEATWTQIQRHHPAVPGVVVTLGCGTQRPGALTLGHFAADRWVQGENTVHELFVGGEGLLDGPVELLGTLLHEAAHGVATQREIKDTSRQGRWHNDRYRVLAEEVGLVVTCDKRVGWSTTTVPESTRARYRSVLAELNVALIAYRRPEQHQGRRQTGNGLVAVCGCDRRLRMSRRAYDAGPVLCGACGGPFTVGDED